MKIKEQLFPYRKLQTLASSKTHRLKSIGKGANSRVCAFLCAWRKIEQNILKKCGKTVIVNTWLTFFLNLCARRKPLRTG
ncbi:hypothetical protein [Blautia massiliensis (ex Durand et al. 2017)]|uniref:hypothetical protein n=1 Tax=Blautia massiliensis (ex Durand et al. 2017) TaxID=1737424 RepID=UPI0022E3986E|nr:hypothetical protein [Blautia massiliensis (ex Durand et al. 2017)]